MEILPRLDLRCKISQGSRRGSPFKDLLTPKESKKVKGINPSLKRGKVVVPMLRSLFILSVVEKMRKTLKLLHSEVYLDFSFIIYRKFT